MRDRADYMEQRHELITYCETFHLRWANNFPKLDSASLHELYEEVRSSFTDDEFRRTTSPQANANRLKLMHEEIMQRPFNNREGRPLSEERGNNYFDSHIRDTQKHYFIFVDYPNSQSIKGDSEKPPSRLSSGFNKDIERVTNIRDYVKEGDAEILSLVYLPVPPLITQSRVELLAEDPSFYSQDSTNVSQRLLPLFKDGNEWDDPRNIRSRLSRLTFFGSSYSGCHLIESLNNLRNKLPAHLYECLSSSAAVFMNAPYKHSSDRPLVVASLYGENDLSYNHQRGLFLPTESLGQRVFPIITNENISPHHHKNILNQESARRYLNEYIRKRIGKK